MVRHQAVVGLVRAHAATSTELVELFEQAFRCCQQRSRRETGQRVFWQSLRLLVIIMRLFLEFQLKLELLQLRLRHLVREGGWGRTHASRFLW